MRPSVGTRPRGGARSIALQPLLTPDAFEDTTGRHHSNTRWIERQAVNAWPAEPILILVPSMQRQIQLLRQLVEDSQYAVDPMTVADAIFARAMARRSVMGTSFRNDVRAEQVRSFRPSRQARSFRPCTDASSEDGLLAIAPWRRR